MSKKSKKQGKQNWREKQRYPRVVVDDYAEIFKSLPLILFTAVVIAIVRAAVYTRPMDQFYWSTGSETLTDFFSYCKMIAIITCAILAILFLLYRVMTQTLDVKRTFIYIPMAVYSVFVLLSYIFSDYKDFALLGYNGRFEGTLVLLAYMVMLFYAVNTVDTEKHVKYVLYPVAVSSALLGLIGVTQALGHDFFKTRVGLKLIIPSVHKDLLDNMSYTFSKQIYQTVYNINYVSFYLTLLLPIFGLLFINSVMKGKKENLGKKIMWGGLFALLLFNMIGAASSGGFLGMGVVIIFAVIFLNRKILSWWKPVAILLLITVAVGGVTADRWLPEIRNAVKTTLTAAVSTFTAEVHAAAKKAKTKSYIDYMNVNTEDNSIDLSINGNALTIMLIPDADTLMVGVFDDDGGQIGMTEQDGKFFLDDDRFSMCSIVWVADDEDGNSYFALFTDGYEWDFVIKDDGTHFINEIGNIAELKQADAIGFKNHLSFGTNRGYIWSRTFPMMLDTMFVGYGADTYCIYFPQNDYVGRYNAGWEYDPGLGAIIDKPHDMYMGMAVGTGGISMLAFLAIIFFYFVQSIRLYWRREFNGFLEFAGLGIFLGALGFSVTGLVDDSSVSVMPLFYGLLGTGIAVNMMVMRIRLNER